jgi:hypothetical protein
MLLNVHVQVDLAKRRREDRLISRRSRQRPFSTAGALRGNLAFGGHISTRNAIRRLHHQGMRTRRPIKRPQLTLRHRHARFDWSHDHLGWTIRTWRWVHWSDESRFFKPYRRSCKGLAPTRWVHWSDESRFLKPYRRSCKGLAPTKHFISGQPHFRYNCFWGWGCNCLGLFSL